MVRGWSAPFVTPYLQAKQHETPRPDVRPPGSADLVEYVPGSISNPTTWPAPRRGWTRSSTWSCATRAAQTRPTTSSSDILNNYEVNTVGAPPAVVGPRRAWASRPASTSARGASTSSAGGQDGRIAATRPRDAWPSTQDHVYGFTKGLGELDLPALRRSTSTCASSPADHRSADARGVPGRSAGCRSTRTSTCSTRRDLANAILSALEVVKVGRNRFDAVPDLRATSTRSTTT